MVDVRKIVESVSSGELEEAYQAKLSNVLYPSAFVNENSWRHVTNAIKLHDQYVKEYLIRALEEILKCD